MTPGFFSYAVMLLYGYTVLPVGRQVYRYEVVVFARHTKCGVAIS